MAYLFLVRRSHDVFPVRQGFDVRDADSIRCFLSASFDTRLYLPRFCPITRVVYCRISGAAIGVFIIYTQLARGSPRVRIPFIFGLSNIVVPIWATIAKIPPPTSNSASLFYGFVYLFPCVVAIVTAGHRAKTSNQSLQPTAGRSEANLSHD
jgi:hypothetical protein